MNKRFSVMDIRPSVLISRPKSLMAQLVAGEDDPAPHDPPETFKFKDPVTNEDVELPKSMETLMGHVISKSRKDVEGKYKPLLDELKTKNSDILTKYQTVSSKIEELEMANMSVEEKAKAMMEKDKKKWQTDLDTEKQRADQGWTKFFETKQQNDIMKALGKHNVYNAAQAMNILKSDGEVKVVQDEETKQYKTVIALSLPDESGNLVVQELDPQTAVDKYLALPSSANLLKDNLTPGSGTSQTGGSKGADGTIEYTRAAMADSKIRKEYNEKLAKGEKVKIVP